MRALLVLMLTSRLLAQPYPAVQDPAKVGTYPMETKSGGGLMYDDVLEYRVWYHNAAGHDSYQAFATYAAAQAFSKKQAGAEPPLVLVRQKEWINEEPGQPRVVKRGTRLTEWKTEWLKDNKRTPELVKRLMKGQ